MAYKRIYSTYRQQDLAFIKSILDEVRVILEDSKLKENRLGVAASKLAIEDSGLRLDEIDKERVGVSIGSGLGGVLFHEDQIATMYEKGFNRAEPLGVPKVAPNAVSGYVAIQFGFKGPNVAPS